MFFRQAEVREINEEIDKRDISGAKLLKNALKRADVLRDEIEGGTFDQKYQALIAETYLESNEENRKIREDLIEELRAKMKRDRDEARFKSEQQM